MCMVRSELQAALRRSDRPLAHTRATATLLSLGCMHLAARTIIRYRPGGPVRKWRTTQKQIAV